MQVKRIGVAVATTYSYDRSALRGILSYCQTHGKWEFFRNENALGPAHTLAILGKAVKTNNLQGIIIDLWFKEILDDIMAWGLPVVELSGTVGAALPSVHVDNDLVGTMAAQHLLERGLSHFGFVAWYGSQHCEERKNAFVRTIQQAGRTCEVLTLWSPIDKNSSANEGLLHGWLKALPKPSGVLGWFDYAAADVIRACRELGLLVPREVAVVGVNNDELDCGMSEPPMSSVDVNASLIGYQAAKLMHRLLDGKKPPAKAILVPPKGVVVRRSSDTLASAKPEMAKALQFIRDHANEGIRVSDVLRNVPISRRALEMEMSRLLGRSPFHQIRYEQIEHAKALLLDSDLSILAVARSCGFHSASLFCRAYKSAVGSSPAKFRAKHRVVTL